MTRHYPLPPPSAPPRAVISDQMRLRTLVTAALTLALTLAVAAPAMAHAGEGWAGELNDKVITFFSLGVMLFFVLVIVVFSAIQGRLEKRKEQKKAAQSLARVGW
jgi:heme/copper-type cytochrome/quinol oxidase subunit 2